MTWYKSKGSGGQYIVIEESTGNTVAVVYNSGNEKETEYEAKLIAAAPESHKALCDLLEFNRELRNRYPDLDTNGFGSNSDVIGRAQSAIADVLY